MQISSPMPCTSVRIAYQCNKSMPSTSTFWAPTVCQKFKLSLQSWHYRLYIVINQKVNAKLWKLLSDWDNRKWRCDVDLSHVIRIKGQSISIQREGSATIMSRGFKLEITYLRPIRTSLYITNLMSQYKEAQTFACIHQ